MQVVTYQGEILLFVVPKNERNQICLEIVHADLTSPKLQTYYSALGR